jgi:uncharacterized membrane protein YgaE (UPF0421/DUF939 family)
VIRPSVKLTVKSEKPSLSDYVFVLSLTIASLISYSVTVYILHPILDKDNDLLGGMWAAVATVFVFRETNDLSLRAALARLFATLVSFALCLLYLLILPFNPVGMAALIGLGALVVIFLGRRDDVITTGITTVVIMVVAALSPGKGTWLPALRLLDTVIGIAVGIASAWFWKGLFVRGHPEK